MLTLRPKVIAAEHKVRRIRIQGHTMGLRLEAEVWSGLVEMARREELELPNLIAWVAEFRPHRRSLAAVLRLAVLAYYRAAATEAGHAAAGHGSAQGSGGRRPLVAAPETSPITMGPSAGQRVTPPSSASQRGGPDPAA